MASRQGKVTGFRVAVILGAALLVVTAVTGCGLFGGDGPRTVVDSVGREVTLERSPKRIVSMAPSNTEILFALGLGDRVVGVTNFCNYPPEAADIEKVGDHWAPDYEKIVALEPDLVLAVGTAESQIVKDLESYGLKVFVVEAETVDEVADNVELVGRITGAVKEAEALAGDIRSRIDAVRQRVAETAVGERPSVFWVLDSMLWTVGPGSFVHDLITVAGGENVAASSGQAYCQFSMESLLAADPDVIIMPIIDPAAADALAANEGWESLTAVKEGRVHMIDPDIVSRPGPRIAEAIERVAAILYPEAGEDSGD